MQSSRTVQILIGAVVVTALLAVGYYVFFDQIRKKNEEILRLTQEIDQTLEQQRRARSQKDLLDSTTQARAQLDTYFIGSDRLVGFLEKVENLGEIAGVEVQVESVGAVNSNEDAIYETLRLSLTANGDWQSVYYFYTLLELLPYQIVFQKVNFQSSDNEPDTWTSSIVFTVIKLK